MSDALIPMQGAPAAPAREYRFRAGVARVSRPGGMVLVAPEDGRAVRVSPVAHDLLPLLADGASFDELLARLRERHPRAADAEAKLAAFLHQLERAGLLATLSGGATRRAAARWPLIDADPLARGAARVLQRLPGAWGWGLLGLLGAGALAAVVVLAAGGRLPHPTALFSRFSVWGLAVFVFVVVVAHEAAHAVACRLAGVPVGDAGLIFHGGLVPGPYVNTSHVYRLARRAPRFWVAAAGPLVDFLALGAAAGWLLAVDDPSAPAGQAAATLFLLCAAFLYLDTNPLAPSDGSRMVEAWLGDELARRSALTRHRARLSGWKTVAWYRIACSTHLQLSAALLYGWWVLARH
jgi:putative peptide zinc metalloprotease protein